MLTARTHRTTTLVVRSECWKVPQRSFRSPRISSSSWKISWTRFCKNKWGENSLEMNLNRSGRLLYFECYGAASQFHETMSYPGLSMDVSNTLDFHFSPPKLLYIREATYPAVVPRQTYNTIAQVIRAPLLAGERKPKQANATIIILTFCLWHWTFS